MLDDCKHPPVAFAQFQCAQTCAPARAGNAVARWQCEASAMGGADQVAGIVAQKAVGREVHRPALVRTDIDPGPGSTLQACHHQVHRAVGPGNPELPERVFGELFAVTKELQPRVIGLGIQ